jgi:hypothetical protein
MRRFPLAAAVASLVACLASTEARSDHSVHVLLGQKHTGDDRFLVPEAGSDLGVLLSFGGADWPIHIAVDLLATSADGSSRFGPDVQLDTFEAAVGVRKFWKTGQARPYVGGGVVYVQATYEERRDDPISSYELHEEPDGYGPWVCGGVAWRLGKRVDLGFDVRWEIVGADLQYRFGGTLENIDFGGFSYGLTLGFEW